MAPPKKKSRPAPKRYHGYAVFLFIMGTLFPPLAVAARFGIGGDFWLNLLLTLCGYIPGHAHNFYIQNIRNNKTHKRTPKWAQRYGLVNTSKIERDDRKSQWASRYNDRLPRSTLESQQYEEGQEHGSSVDLPMEGNGEREQRRQPNGEFWRQEDESYYGQGKDSNTSRSSGRWRYPANFDDTILVPEDSKKSKKKKKEKKDRWARTEDAYSHSEERSGKKSKRLRSKSSASIQSGVATTEFPEDPTGGLYGDHSGGGREPEVQAGDDIFKHQF